MDKKLKLKVITDLNHSGEIITTTQSQSCCVKCETTLWAFPDNFGGENYSICVSKKCKNYSLNPDLNWEKENSQGSWAKNFKEIVISVINKHFALQEIKEL